jgi:hypothetical protein
VVGPIPIALISCADKSTQPPDDSACGVQIAETWPEQGAADAYYRGDITFSLDGPDPTAAVALADCHEDCATPGANPDCPLSP